MGYKFHAYKELTERRERGGDLAFQVCLWRRCAAISSLTGGRPTIGLGPCNLIEDLETQEQSSPEFLSQLLRYGLVTSKL